MEHLIKAIEELRKVIEILIEELEAKDRKIGSLMCDIEEMYSRADVDHLISLDRKTHRL